jgi:hypothetical protein
MTRAKSRVALGVVASVLLVVLSAVLFACSQTPTSVPVRTFERAQRMDVACMQLYDPETIAPREPTGRPQEECAPVPADLNGETFGKQLYAFVTQSTRGEVAVVNLSAGRLVDQSRATPGTNFLPVGALPTDVATTPDGKMVFVGSAEANKPAIYGIPTRRLLGDTDARFAAVSDPEPVSVASWPVCALEQAPGALTVVPRRAPAPGAAGDAGAGDAGDAGDAGAADSDLPDYELVVVLPGTRTRPAKIVTIDPRPFRRGGLRRLADGKPDYTSDHLPGEPTLAAGPILEPGGAGSAELPPCPILSAIELVGGDTVPTSFVPGPNWDTGVKYVDGGTDLTCNRPLPSGRCGLPPCCANVDPGVADAGDAGTGAAEAGADGGAVNPGACAPVTAADAGPVPLDFGPLDAPRLVSIVRDDTMVYVADEGVPYIHVIDMANPAAPRELPPLLATSVVDPARVVKVKEISISPSTRDYKRYLYAVDQAEGSIMVYDVTDPTSTQRTPLTRPHPELDPFQPPDRIAFSSPVVSVAFARHDVPLDPVRVPGVSAAGVLCNPNPAIDAKPFENPGFFYRANQTEPGQDLGPRRLRGVFAFATLANGQVLTIDVDDWDSPCRRPRDMTRPVSDIAPAEPAVGDTDPYHAPTVGDLTVTNESFFPMSAPHSLRSEVLVRDDPSSGNQLPRLQGPPTIATNGVILAQAGPGSENTPLLSMRFAFEDPHSHIDQDWALTYEGAIPGFDNLSGILETDDGFKSLTMKQPEARFCAKGVEDWALGMERTESIARELARRNVAPAARAERLMTDYVQFTEEILPPEDVFWTTEQACWVPSPGQPALAPGPARQDACFRTFGAAVDQNPQRDFPIVEAYDDHVVLGRFYTTPEKRREVVYKDDSNPAYLKLAQCCFHNQAKFKVRTGQLWSAVGQTVGGGPGVGFLNHLTTDAGGRCVPSCDPRLSLLNARVPTAPNGVVVDLNTQRNSILAARNPMFAMSIVGGGDNATPIRDTQYTFSTRGQFRALFVSIAGSSTAVVPQSMRYVEALGQMAVVDAASQGLVLLDLRAVTVARAPYF